MINSELGFEEKWGVETDPVDAVVMVKNIH